MYVFLLIRFSSVRLVCALARLCIFEADRVSGCASVGGGGGGRGARGYTLMQTLVLTCGKVLTFHSLSGGSFGAEVVCLLYSERARCCSVRQCYTHTHTHTRHRCSISLWVCFLLLTKHQKCKGVTGWLNCRVKSVGLKILWIP